ncbi:MAG: FhaA domain-containing protein [Pyrinomonadaceae bacterium]
MGFLDTLRRWVDGDDGEDALSRAAAEHAKPRRQAEQFIAQIARSIGEVMHDEAVPLPPDQTVIPPEYIVYISDEDDRDWQGIKRKALEQGLYHVLAEHARDLAGKTKLATTSFSVELRVDGTLQKGEVRVQHSWEETSSSNKTSITPRKRPAGETQEQLLQKTPPTPLQPQAEQPQPAFEQPHFNNSSQLAPTMLNSDLVVPQQTEANEDSTRVKARDESGETGLDNEATRVQKRELYRLEVWRDNLRQAVIPVFKDEISIGRKSSKITSDIQLDGDPEISRPHTILRRDSEGKLWIVHKGKNPTIVNGRQAPAEQPVPLQPGEPIAIGSYLLRVLV